MEKLDEKTSEYAYDSGKGQSEAPDYQAWKERKIRDRKAWADANPDKMIPLDDVMKEFGLER